MVNANVQISSSFFLYCFPHTLSYVWLFLIIINNNNVTKNEEGSGSLLGRLPGAATYVAYGKIHPCVKTPLSIMQCNTTNANT